MTRQRGSQPQNRALCCECGELRTVAQSYRGRRPAGATTDPAGTWCIWLRCAHCSTTTVHALVVDALAEEWRSEGCDRERGDRLADRFRRRVSRRLDALAAEGVTIVRVLAAAEMSVNDAVLEVVEYDDPRDFVLRVRVTARPGELVDALEVAKDLIDGPAGLGPWSDGPATRWRGIAVCSVFG